MKELVEEDRIAIAEALYLAGFKPYYSSNIAEQLICGYGKLDWDFQYPLMLNKNEEIVITVKKV